MSSHLLLKIRVATEQDVPLILGFIRELAEYEKMAHLVQADEGALRRHLFGQQPCAEVLIAEWDASPVGFALYFQSFSTFVGKPGLYLEDLFVREAYRGKGVGKNLLIRLAQIARERDYGRMEWSVLDWNEPSIAFYKSLGATPMDEWTVYRLTGDSLARLADTD